MKKLALVTLAVVSLVLTGSLFAQRGTAEAKIAGKSLSIDYGRPALQGRDMLAKLPVGQTWRMGSNAATTLTTDGKLAFGDKVLEAGTYTLTAKRVDESTFHLLAAKDGATVEIPLASSKVEPSVETFTIAVEPKGGNKGEFSLVWGTTKLAAGLSVQ